MNIVSRGGSLVFAWMSMTGEENPFYEYYDEILDICEQYDVTISLGDACRPGCLADATDVCQIEELVRLGELTKRAWDHNVQVMVEGPGHVPLDQVAANMKVQQTICMGAPFYVLGPLVTDIAPGYDHITAAIGGAVAAMNGAAFLCYVTPAEHLALPNVEDTKQGIIASKIAAHAADIAKGIPGARDIDDKMADARRVLDWDAQFACALDPETAKAIRDDRLPEKHEHGEAITTATKDIRSFAPSCSRGDRTRYFLKVQDGCDYFCSYLYNSFCTWQKPEWKNRGSGCASQTSCSRRWKGNCTDRCEYR